MTPSRPLAPLLVAVALLAGCSSGDDEPSGGAATSAPADDVAADGSDAGTPRFCDAFLDYLAEPAPEQLQVVRAAADDPQVDELVEIIATDDRTGRVLAADSDLQAVARERCQAEWVGAAQGGGDTAGAAQAFFDALVAGDPIGARNVASENAIARFEPWAPIEPDAEAGTPSLLTVGTRTFTMALGPDRIAECQVEAGVVLTCAVAE